MQEEVIEKILIKYKLISLENELFMKRIIKKIINSLNKCNKGEYIYPDGDIYWEFRENKDFVYAVLDALEKEKILKLHVLLRCCRCGREKVINTYLMKNEEMICEECGADNDDRDSIVAYEIL